MKLHEYWLGLHPLDWEFALCQCKPIKTSSQSSIIKTRFLQYISGFY